MSRSNTLMSHLLCERRLASLGTAIFESADESSLVLFNGDDNEGMLSLLSYGDDAPILEHTGVD
jgi:hypothetical protein